MAVVALKKANQPDSNGHCHNARMSARPQEKAHTPEKELTILHVCVGFFYCGPGTYTHIKYLFMGSSKIVKISININCCDLIIFYIPVSKWKLYKTKQSLALD